TSLANSYVAPPGFGKGMGTCPRHVHTLSWLPTCPEYRLPLHFVPDTDVGLPPALDAAELNRAHHTIVAVLADERMAQRVRGGNGEAWGHFLAQHLEDRPPGQGLHCILPIALARMSGCQCIPIPSWPSRGTPGLHGC